MRPSARLRDGPKEHTEHAVIELHAYDLRKRMTSQDPLCCVQVFKNRIGATVSLHCTVSRCALGARIVQILTFRVWIKLPATQRRWEGGCAEQTGWYGAMEAQKSDGALHLHLAHFLQTAGLDELASMLEKQLLNMTTIKISRASCGVRRILT